MALVDLRREWSRIQWIADRRTIEEWASQHVTLPPTLTFQGKFNPAISRQFIEPLRALQSGRVREVNVCAPPRSGKTLIADTFAPWALAQDPGPVLWVFSGEDQANLHCETRLMPILHGCEPVRAMLPADRHKIRATEIQLANGYPIHVRGPAISNLQARGYRYLIADEVWLWPSGRLGEAKTRVHDFAKIESSKVLCISQGGEGGGEWYVQYHSGRLHEWEVPCDSCGAFQIPTWSGKHDDGRRFGIVYDADKRPDGSADVEQARRSVRYVCRFCDHEHRDCAATQGRWNAAGRYRAQDDGSEVNRSYHWNNIICARWPDMVERWLSARHQARRGNWAPLVAFEQKDLAKFSSERAVTEQDSPLARIELSGSTEWPKEKLRMLTVDVQRGFYFVMARAWAADGESRRLHWGIVQTDTQIEELRKKLNIKPAATIIDCADRSQEVYRLACNYGWLCARGSPKDGFLHHVEEADERGQKRMRVVKKPFSTVMYGEPEKAGLVNPRAKAKVYQVSREATADRLRSLRDCGLWTEPKVEPKTQEEQDYEDMMNSPAKVSKRPGEPAKWEIIGVEPHAWDCARMQVFGAMAVGVC